MKVKITLVRSSNQSLRRKPAPGPVPKQYAPNAQMISAKFSTYLKEPTLEALRNQKPVRISPEKVRNPSEPVRIPPAKERQRPGAAGGLLGRALSWLNANRSTPRRLRVLETVTLGDKRLVAVIQADGCRFLVGGGPSGVSLLTPLDQSNKELEDFEASAGLTELAG